MRRLRHSDDTSVCVLIDINTNRRQGLVQEEYTVTFQFPPTTGDATGTSAWCLAPAIECSSWGCHRQSLGDGYRTVCNISRRFSINGDPFAMEMEEEVSR